MGRQDVHKGDFCLKNAHEPRGEGLFIPDDDSKESVPVYIQPPKPKVKYAVPWGSFWMERSEIGVTFMEQAESRLLSLTDYRVRDFILGLIGLGNFVHVSHTDVGKALHIARPHVSASIRNLCRLGILNKGPSAGRFNSYEINPAMLYRGNLSEGLKQRRAAITRAKVIRFREPEQRE